MRPIPFVLFLVAGICALIGMAWGIQMSATGDHGMAAGQCHAQNRGWVRLAVCATF